ncbi:MAG TPA: aminomethyl-transferring glycine dehydrogenase [Phycisphaerales bacterium]|nr:aminomethyl-transferring glycine dehydrogenase [Phycisphaerales bacterium]
MPTTTTRPPASVPATNGSHATQPSSAAPDGCILNPSDTFIHRHIGPDEQEQKEMLSLLGYSSLDAMADAAVPPAIRLRRPLQLEGIAGGARAKGEFEVLQHLKSLASQNKVYRSFIGQGYYDTITPPVILRNILENPGWYTQYTPYQAEISQGRLEALLNFQTMISDLTGLPLAGASLLDEGTAAAEAMAMCHSIAGGHDGTKHRFFVDQGCHPQTIAVVQTRAKSLGITITIGDHCAKPDGAADLCGILVQYPTTDGRIVDYSEMCERAHAAGITVVAAADLLALTLIKPPGEWGGGGADICVGSAQRFGVPMGAGGPHAAFIATKAEHARKMPGRIIGVSKDAQGNMALRMAIQTREQHIKRERATSNICTAQALLAIIAGMYAVYHGPEGLKAIARRVHASTVALRDAMIALDHAIVNRDHAFFDTIRVKPKANGESASQIASRLSSLGVNARMYADGTLGFSCDETTDTATLDRVVAAFNAGKGGAQWQNFHDLSLLDDCVVYARKTPFLTHPVFNSHHSETEMLRYIFQLQGRDLSLAHSMIPLGSCTMKLNATSEMIPVTWPEFGRIHPFAPADQQKGYAQMYRDLESWLAEITGVAATSLQPNAGSQGEYAGLLAIHAYHASRGQGHRNICLIPDSAHGTNPASATTAGMKVVAVANRENGDIDLEDLKNKAAEHKDNLAALMVTYPSTYGVFEEHIKEVCRIVHENGGQVYMDGANMNAQVGLCRPGDIGADVCHLNLHKTFCIPHGGGGPGMGPICVAAHLKAFLPGDPAKTANRENSKSANEGVGPVSSANYGSASILVISWMYIAMMGEAGLKQATEVAILNANYMAKRLEKHYKVLFTGPGGRCAHEFIIDCGHFEKSAGIKSEDIAKRLMDYGFHAPTMSFPVAGTLMIEPTESEPKEELDRFCDAMIAIRQEIADIEAGRLPRDDNPLRNAPHTAHTVTADEWKHAYTRSQAAWPLPYLRRHKFWPAVGRIDNPYGDRHLACACPPMSAYTV